MEYLVSEYPHLNDLTRLQWRVCWPGFLISFNSDKFRIWFALTLIELLQSFCCGEKRCQEVLSTHKNFTNSFLRHERGFVVEQVCVGLRRSFEQSKQEELSVLRPSFVALASGYVRRGFFWDFKDYCSTCAALFSGLIAANWSTLKDCFSSEDNSLYSLDQNDLFWEQRFFDISPFVIESCCWYGILSVFGAAQEVFFFLSSRMFWLNQAYKSLGFAQTLL